MCVIVYKPKGVAFPSKSTLKTCFENNPDGAGYMLAVGGLVLIEKGFMNFSAFYKALKRTRKQYGDNVPYVMHFRITTQAGTRPDCCHPYPLSDDMVELRKLKNTALIGVAHNGIISLTTDRWNTTVTYNDTMKFITDYLTLIIDRPDWYTDSNKIKLITRLCESKLAILDKSGRCDLIGEGWLEHDGVMYSNNSYLKHTYKSLSTIPSYGKTSEYEWGEDDYDYGDPWETYFDDVACEYIFDESNCPLSIDVDESYCCCCENRKTCKLRAEWNAWKTEDVS